jgi:hypothetical protein
VHLGKDGYGFVEILGGTKELPAYSSGRHRTSNVLNRRLVSARLAIDNILDDLIESHNGLELDVEWSKRQIAELCQARYAPEQYLAKRVP